MTSKASSRKVVLDTETTGFSPNDGHRIVEIGAVVIEDRKLTGETFHVYLNPERDVPAGSTKVHGLTDEFLSDKPRFADIARDFCLFIKGCDVIAHNANFDVSFLNHEMALVAGDRAPTVAGLASDVIDTLKVARKAYPGKKNTLDALSDRLGVDRSKRTSHGALIDSQILADVFLALTREQWELSIGRKANTDSEVAPDRKTIDVLVIEASEQELKSHAGHCQKIMKASGGLVWPGDYSGDYSGDLPGDQDNPTQVLGARSTVGNKTGASKTSAPNNSLNNSRAPSAPVSVNTAAPQPPRPEPVRQPVKQPAPVAKDPSPSFSPSIV